MLLSNPSSLTHHTCTITYVPYTPHFYLFPDAGQTVIDELHGKGKGVVCYISIGTMEDWREDKNEFPAEAIGGGVDGWAGEKWLDVNNRKVREVMSERVQQAASMNCDAVVSDSFIHV